METVPLAALEPLVIRPRDLADRYANPPVEVRRLVANGVLQRLAHGYYAIIPEALRGTNWLPSVEGVALGIAQRDGGRDDVTLMGISAARVLDVVPRAMGRAVVATARQRPEVATVAGPVTFVTRAVDRLDVQRCTTDLATGWTTTIEQTVLDLADRPDLAQLPVDDLAASIAMLGRQADWTRVDGLAADQRKAPAAKRAAWIAGATVPALRTSRPVDPLGFEVAIAHDPEPYGIRTC